MKPIISVIVPAYNEEKLLPITLITLNRSSWLDELIVVNDGSTDRTGLVADKYSSKVIHLEKNIGKAQALKAGWQAASGDIVLCLDADLGITAREAEKLIEEIAITNNDCIIARLPEQKQRGLGIMKHRAQKLIFSKTGQWFDAPLSGQRAIKKKWVEMLLEKNYVGFGVEMAMTIDLMKAGAQVSEVDVQFFHRATGKDLKGFVHRGRQWFDMEKTLWRVRSTW